MIKIVRRFLLRCIEKYLMRSGLTRTEAIITSENILNGYRRFPQGVEAKNEIEV